MSFLSRLRRTRPATDEPPADGAPADSAAAPTDAPTDAPPEPPAPGPPPAAMAIACPSCARLVDPPPARNRRCPHCRQLIVVRRTGGRTVYLTEAAVEVFEAQRRREANVVAWTAARAEWLRLARGVGAPDDRRQRIAAKPVSEDAVAEARTLYLSAATRAATAARRAGHWDDVARVGRDRAAALFRDAGSPVPPPEEIATIHAEAMTALLRSLRGMGTHAEVVGATCCPACRRDDGRGFAIADELKTPRLPHPGCPRGLCPCEWWVGGTPKKKKARRKRTASA